MGGVILSFQNEKAAGKGRVGLTTTAPVEVIYAAGYVPVDLNNLFIGSPAAMRRVEEAELAGFPRNICGWIKGLYGTVLHCPEIKKIIAVTQGDCSNTQALMETWEFEGLEIIPFAYSFDRDPGLLRLQMEKLCAALGGSWEEVCRQKRRLDKVRALAWEIDRLTWDENLVSGLENHLYLVSCSDFNGDPEGFSQDMSDFIQAARGRKPFAGSFSLQTGKTGKEGNEGSEFCAGKEGSELRLGYIGVPPIFPELYAFLEERGARVVFNEVQRQFAMPFQTEDVVEQYRLYTYPYSVFQRIQDIGAEAKRRRLDGIIHYTQSFCYRQIQDLIIRKTLSYPILTLEGENPVGLDARGKMRIEAFLSMIRGL